MQTAGTAAWMMAAICITCASAADGFHPQVPRTWDETAISTIEVPLSHPEYSPKHISADFYYKMPVRPIYESYPVYHPDREPPGYIDWLKQREPRLLWDTSKLRTREDWIR